MEKSDVKLWTRNFVLVVLINFFVFMNHITVLNTFPFYVEKLGGTEAAAGLAVTLFSLVAVLCRPFIGRLLDGGRRKTVLFAGLLGLALMPLGYMAAAALLVAFIFRMVHGAALSCANTAAATLATDAIPRPRFAEGMGMFGTATALATACAPALGLFLMNRFGFSPLYLCAAGFSLAALLLFAFLRAPRVEPSKKPFRFKDLLDKDAMPASVIFLVFLLTFGAIESFAAKFSSQYGLPGGGVYFAVLSAMLLLCRMTLGKVADRRGEGVFVYTCNAAMLLALLLLALVPGKATFILSAALAGYGFGGLEPAMQTMAVHIAPPDRRGAANSTFLCAYDIGIGCGGGIAGLLITLVGYHGMFAAMAAANVAAVVLYLLWGRKQPAAFKRRQP